MFSLASKRYRGVFKIPGAKSLLIISFIIRMGNIPLGTLLTISVFALTDDWTVAAIAAGVFSFSQSISVWFGGRLMDKYGMRPIIWITFPFSILPIALFFINGDTAIIVFSFIIGFFRPPLGTSMRSCWSILVPKQPLRSAAYSLDSSLSPIAGSIGAALGGILLLVSPLAILIMLALLGLVGGIGLLFHKATDHPPTHKVDNSVDRKQLPPLGTKTWLAIAAGAMSWSVVVSIEIAIGIEFGPSFLAWSSALAIFAVIIGATQFAGNNAGRTSLWYSGRSILIIAGLFVIIMLLLAISLSKDWFFFPVLIVIFYFPIGWARGFISSSATASISETAPESRMSEAMGLYGTGVLAVPGISRIAAGLIVSPLLILIVPAIASFLVWKMIDDVIRKE